MHRDYKNKRATQTNPEGILQDTHNPKPDAWQMLAQTHDAANGSASPPEFPPHDSQ
ncbi:MAG: hypothetical protein IJU35_04505 [Paludibacteraceae bacterium]|nr:hypothetical protein [Paludibacteraceae bacterium]